MALRRFSQQFCAPGLVVFLAGSEATGPDGGTAESYPDPSAGVVVSANVQIGSASRAVADGVDRWTVPVTVCLLDDPCGLNGGLGVRRNDAFNWSLDKGRLYVAQGDASRVGSVWRVDCLARQ